MKIYVYPHVGRVAKCEYDSYLQAAYRVEHAVRTSPYFTHSPRNADLFLISGLPYPCGLFRNQRAAENGTVFELLMQRYRAINASGPFFMRRGGRDHFETWPSDSAVHSFLLNPVRLRLEALDSSHDFFNPIRPQRGVMHLQINGGKEAHFVPGHDIVLPQFPGQVDAFDPSDCASLGPTLASQPTPRAPRAARDTLFFFAGTMNSSMAYIDPGRTALAKLAAAPRFLVHDGSAGGARVDGRAMMRRAEFCGVPHGMRGGYGGRWLPSVQHGCIPVFLYDQPPLAEAVPWERMSITVSLDEVQHLPERLAAISLEERQHMRSELARQLHRVVWLPSNRTAARYGTPESFFTHAWREFRAATRGCDASQGSDAGVDAFDTLIEVLEKRTAELGPAPTLPNVTMRRTLPIARGANESTPLQQARQRIARLEAELAQARQKLARVMEAVGGHEHVPGIGDRRGRPSAAGASRAAPHGGGDGNMTPHHALRRLTRSGDESRQTTSRKN